MKRPKFTEEQIAFALKQGESGVTVAEVCRLNEYLLGEVERRRKKDRTRGSWRGGRGEVLEQLKKVLRFFVDTGWPTAKVETSTIHSSWPLMGR